jgi:hypothetical protein
MFTGRNSRLAIHRISRIYPLGRYLHTFLFAGALLLQTMSHALAAYYVAPNGNDGWSGKLPEPNASGTDGPLASLGRARDLIREMKSAGGLKEPITVHVRGGRYAMAEPLVFTPQDSGTPQYPITYAAYSGERPILSGGRAITAWKPAENGLWKAELPEVKAGKWYFTQLWINGERRVRPRCPKEGTFAVVEGAEPQTKAIRYNPGDFHETWSNREDIEVIVLQFWTEARLRIADVDPQSRTVTFTGSCWRPLTWSSGYYIENVFEALGEPGQWYLDRKTGVLYYKPLPGEDMAKAEVIAPVTEQIVRLEGNAEPSQCIEHIVFRGLSFEHAAWKLPSQGLAYPQAEIPVGAAICAQWARKCAFEDCEIAHADSWGIELGRGCKQCRLVGNTIHDVGAGGIKIGESCTRDFEDSPKEQDFQYRPPRTYLTDAEESSGHLVSDSVLSDGARTYFGAPAIWVGQSGHNTISHNEVTGPWDFGISVGWNWESTPPNRTRDNIIEYNHVHHVGSLFDSYSIYLLGIQPGTVIRNNLVHHGTGFGIAFDAASGAIHAENNIVHHQRGGALHFNWYCLGNVVENNIFALNGEAQMTRYGDPPKNEDTNCNVLQCNIVYWNGGRLFKEKRWENYRMVLDYNLYFDASGAPPTFLGMSLDEWRKKGVLDEQQKMGLDTHSLVADPLFVNPEQDDYRLKPESPAWKLGFQVIDLSDIGPRKHKH